MKKSQKEYPINPQSLCLIVFICPKISLSNIWTTGDQTLAVGAWCFFMVGIYDQGTQLTEHKHIVRSRVMHRTCPAEFPPAPDWDLGHHVCVL